MVWLNGNYDRNASARGPVLAQLVLSCEWAYDTLTHTQTNTNSHAGMWVTWRMGLAIVKQSR